MQENKHHGESPYLNFQKVTSEGDRNAFMAQLIEAQLSYAGIGEVTELSLLLDAKHRVVGTEGLEWYGQNVLLRSVSVSKFYQGKGIRK